MANQFASISSAAGILKNWYAGALVSQFNDSIPFYKAIEKGREKSAGLQVVRALKVRRNQGIGATSDGGTLPKIGQQTTIQPIISYKFNYLRFGVTGPMLKASQGDKGAFVSIMEYEMEQGMLDFKSDFNRQLFWDGTGKLAVVSANAVNTNVITVSGRESVDNVKYLDVGMDVDIVSGTTVIASGLSITAISGLQTASATVTLSANVSTAANDFLVRSGSYNNEVQGILYTMDGGTTGSIYSTMDRAAYPQVQSNVISNSSGQLTLDVIQNAFNQGRELGDAQYDALFSDFTSERFYNKLLVADKRFIGTKVGGDGSFSDKDKTYLEYGGLPWVSDKDSSRRVQLLDSKTWKKYVLAELEWADETGSYMIAQVSADQFEIRLRHLANLFCEKPRANALVSSYISP